MMTLLTQVGPTPTARPALAADANATSDAPDAAGAGSFCTLLANASATDALVVDGQATASAALSAALAELDDRVSAKDTDPAAQESVDASPQMLLAMLSDAQALDQPGLPVTAGIFASLPPVATSSTVTSVKDAAVGAAALSSSASLQSGTANLPVLGLPPASEPAPTLAAADNEPGRQLHASADPVDTTKAVAEARAERFTAAAVVPAAITSVPATPIAAPLTAPVAAASAAPVPATIAIATPVGNPYFGEEAAQHVSWLVGNGIEQARINVHPADLGPIEIRISMNNNEAIISFAVTQPETGAAIEDALPRLRELLTSNGVSLGQTSVSSDGPQFGAAAGDTGGKQRPGGEATPDLHEASALAATSAAISRQRLATGRGLVDLFA